MDREYKATRDFINCTGFKSTHVIIPFLYFPKQSEPNPNYKLNKKWNGIYRDLTFSPILPPFKPLDLR